MIVELEAIRKEATAALPDIMRLILTSIDGFEFKFIRCRIKPIESINEKMKTLDVGIEGIYDLIGFCIVIPNESNCYDILECIKKSRDISVYNVRDYIEEPADLNKYQAIHIHFKHKELFGEIQVRTIDMNIKAERDYREYKKGMFAEKSSQ